MKTYILSIIAFFLLALPTSASEKLTNLDFTLPEDFTYEFIFGDTNRSVICKLIKDGNHVMYDLHYEVDDAIMYHRVFFKYTGSIWEAWTSQYKEGGKSSANNTGGRFSLSKTTKTYNDLLTALGSQPYIEYVGLLVIMSRQGGVYKRESGKFEDIPSDVYATRKDGVTVFYVAPGTTFCLTMGSWVKHLQTGKKVWYSELQPKSFSTAATDLSPYIP